MITVVGIGADGWHGLAEASRAALRDARVVVGSERQLELLPGDLAAERRRWPSPLTLDGLDDDATVLASGDPLLHGIGATLVRHAGAENVTILPHVSSFALACARMGWPQQDVELVSAVAHPAEAIVAALQPNRRIVAFTSGTDGAAELARVITASGCGDSTFTLLERLGGRDERRTDTTAAAAARLRADPLHLVTLEVSGHGHPRTPGLPDAAYEHDGQLTKRHVRALTIAALGPRPGELLWDVGAGAGSVAIEWLRAERTAQAIAIERDPQRAERTAANARRLGVPRLRVTSRIDGLPAPDVVFVGGGITAMLDPSWEALKPGGRLVANAVTLEGEQALASAREAHGGDLVRVAIEHAEPLGALTGWRPQRAVTQWSATK